MMHVNLVIKGALKVPAVLHWNTLQNPEDKIGEFPFRHKSVFSYYLPDFKPDSFPDGLAAPEFQIFTPTQMISFFEPFSDLRKDVLIIFNIYISLSYFVSSFIIYIKLINICII